MKGRLAKRQGVKRKYDTAADSADTRNTVGAIYAAMKRLGYERHACDAVLSEAGFQYPERTMRRYVQHIEANIPAVLSPGTAGRKRKLSPDQERLFAGFILAKNDCGFVERARLPGGPSGRATQPFYSA